MMRMPRHPNKAVGSTRGWGSGPAVNTLRRSSQLSYTPSPADAEADLSASSPDTNKRAEGRARIAGRNGGTLTPFQPGDRHMAGFNKSANLGETLRLARKHSPDAMRTLIRNLDHEDGRIATMSASLILERAWGKPREMKPEEQKVNIDLSKLSSAELALLMKLVESGRLQAEPETSDQSSPPVIDAEPSQ